MKGQVFSDSELEKVVRELFSYSDKVNPDDIKISVHNNDVTLSGKVRSADEKNIAGSLIQLIHGVGIIYNNLDINDGRAA
jgi:osmotically-inducible protein OsmY